MSKSFQNKLSFEPYQLFIVLHGILLISNLSTWIFLGSMILRVSGDLTKVGLYYLVFYTSLILGFALSAPLCKSGHKRRLYRFSFLGITAFFLILPSLEANFKSLLLPTAVLQGLVYSVYWLPYHQYVVEVSQPSTRSRFVSYLTMVGQFINLVMPVTIGWMIWRDQSFVNVSKLIAAISFLGFLVASYLMPVDHVCSTPYRPRVLLKALRTNVELRSVCVSMFLVGLTTWGLLSQLSPLIVYISTGSELKLGFISSLLPLLEMSVSFFTGRKSHLRYSRDVLVAGVILFSAIFVFVFWHSHLAALVYAFCFSFCAPRLSLIINVFAYNLIQHHPEVQDHQIEYIFLRETACFFGRFIAYGLLAISPFFSSSVVAMQVIMIALSFALLAFCLYLSKSHAEFVKRQR